MKIVEDLELRSWTLFSYRAQNRMANFEKFARIRFENFKSTHIYIFPYRSSSKFQTLSILD